VFVRLVAGRISKLSEVSRVLAMLPVALQASMVVTGRDRFGNLVVSGGEAENFQVTHPEA
jgi:hypothetical protein